MTLIEHLQQVPEFRAARGQRHESWFVQHYSGCVGGRLGYRPLAECVEIDGKEICRKLELAQTQSYLPSQLFPDDATVG